LLVAVMVALAVSFVCSLLEATLLSLRPSQVAEIAQRRPGIGAIWNRLKGNIERPIGVILIVNTAAHTVGAAVSGAEFSRLWGSQWIWLFSLIFTLVMIQFTEILPKTLGVRFNRSLAEVAARPLDWAIRLFSPILALIHWINRPLQFRRRGAAAEPTTVEEITTLAGLARMSRQIGARQERIITGASRLSTLTTSQVMIPVEQISFLSTTQTLIEALVAAHIDAHTRFPICEAGDRNRVVGYVNFKEMIYFMRTNPNEPSLRGVIRPVLTVERTATIPALLELFVAQHGHLAIVRDEAGATVGMVTMEDIIEELVGDIQDEFDHLPKTLQALSEGTWMVGGGAPMTEVVRQTGLELTASTEALWAWLAGRLGRAPVAGDIHHEGGAEFTVRRVRRSKAFDVAITRTRAASPPVPPGAPAPGTAPPSTGPGPESAQH
jgi:CBS domain containing-hemolysin-like protein